MIQLKRYPGNPILSPTSNAWESLQVFNPGVAFDGKHVHLLYRAQGEDDISRLGYAVAADGRNFERLPQWVYEGGGHTQETLGIEDPRIVGIGGLYYVVYTAVAKLAGAVPDPSWREQVVKRIRVSAATTADFQTFSDLDVIIPDMDAKDASLFPGKFSDEFWFLYRNEKHETFFSHSNHLTVCKEPHFVFKERPGFWDSIRTGIGAPPLATELGWLLFYHGVDEANTYSLGVMLLDSEKPDSVLWRSPEPILAPEEDYEKLSFMADVVFTCGAIEWDGQYYVYYGAGDQHIGLATISKADLLSTIAAGSNRNPIAQASGRRITR